MPLLAANILKILIMSKYIKSFWFIVNKLVVFFFISFCLLERERGLQGCKPRSFLRLYECSLPSVILRPYREVNPVTSLFAAFDEQLIVIALRAVGYIHQDVRIA